MIQEDKEKLLEGLRRWGALDAEFRYREGIATSARRGYEIDHGGGLMSPAKPSKPLELSELLQSRLWRAIAAGQAYEFQSTMFQPVGGMDMIAKAFAKQVGNLIRYQARVTRIEQNERGVTVTFADEARGGALQQEKADWCLCTIPLSILSQVDIQVSAEMQAAINAVPYGSSIKVGLQFKRRFWEEDEHIYGGITYTDLPISRISYPSTRYGASGPAVVLGAYVFDGPNSFELARWLHRSASVAPWSMATRSIRSTPTSSTTACQWLGTACPAITAATASGPTRCATSTTRPCARWTVVLRWPASTSPISPRGRKAPSFPHSTQSGACMRAPPLDARAT